MDTPSESRTSSWLVLAVILPLPVLFFLPAAAAATRQCRQLPRTNHSRSPRSLRRRLRPNSWQTCGAALSKRRPGTEVGDEVRRYVADKNYLRPRGGVLIVHLFGYIQVIGPVPPGGHGPRGRRRRRTGPGLANGRSPRAEAPRAQPPYGRAGLRVTPRYASGRIPRDTGHERELTE